MLDLGMRNKQYKVLPDIRPDNHFNNQRHPDWQKIAEITKKQIKILDSPKMCLK